MSYGYLHAPCHTQHHSCCGHSYIADCCGGNHQPQPIPMVVWVPAMPMPCHPPAATTVVRDLEVDAASSPKSALVGGGNEVHLSLETFVEAGAASPEVKIVVTENGTSSTISRTGLPVGYEMDEGFLTVSAGAKVEIAANDAIARLRWCEVVCC